MSHINRNPDPAPNGAIVSLSTQASVTALGEIRLGGGRWYQVRRSASLMTGRTTDYLLDAQGRVFLLRGPDRNGHLRAHSHETGRPLISGGRPVLLRWEGGVLTRADTL